MPPIMKNLKWGVSYGLAFATAYSILVVAQYVIAGASVTESRGVTLGATLSAYFAGGVIGGALVGLLRPLTRWRAGAAAVGIVACLPLSIAFALAFEGAPANWREETIAGGILAAVLIGGVAGYQSWEVRS